MNVEAILSRLSNAKSSMKAAGTYSAPGMSKLCQIIQNLAVVLKEQNKEIECLKSDIMSIAIAKLVVNEGENGYFEQSKIPNENINTLNTSSCEELLSQKDILCKRLIGIEEQLKWLSSEQCRQSKTVQRLNNWSLAHTLNIAKQIVNGKRRIHRPLEELQKQSINKTMSSNKHIDPRPVTTLTSHQAQKRCGEYNLYTMKAFGPNPIQASKDNKDNKTKIRPETTPNESTKDQIILRCKNPILLAKPSEPEVTATVRDKENGDEINKKRKRMESHSNPIDKIKLHTFNFGGLNDKNDTKYDDNRNVPYKQINKIQPITHIQYKTTDIANVAKDIISRNRERNIMNIHQISTKMVDLSDIKRPKSTKYTEYTPIPLKIKNKVNAHKRIKETDVITNSMMLLQKYQTKLRVYSTPCQKERSSKRYMYLCDTKQSKTKEKETMDDGTDYNVGRNESLQDIFFGISRW